MNIIKKFFFNIWVGLRMVLIYLAIALRNTEVELLKADPNNLNERDKKVTRVRHRNQILEKFYAGQTDQKYVQDYYELLKKADSFMRNATKHKKAVAADQWGMNVGRKDKYGRSYDHIGFFDASHKHAGKTVGEVIDIEMIERRTTEDDYELLYIFDNTPIQAPLSKMDDLEDVYATPKLLEFPIIINHDDPETINKIEQLTSFLHVKKLGFEHRQFELFIDNKYKTYEKVTEDSEIFKELIKFNSIYIKSPYGELIGFVVNDYIKRINYKTYDVWIFQGTEMDTIKI